MVQNSNTPLSLHTLPATKPGVEVPKVAQLSKCDTKERDISTSTSTIPRLISVVEIIKREYLNTSGITVLSGLHQYNEVGYLEQLKSSDIATENDDRAQTLATALEGKN